MVSWNDAADTNERVCSDALVMPSRTGVGRGRLLAVGHQLVVELVEVELVELLVLEHAAIARLGDLDLLQHLPDDHLDVLVVDRARPGGDRPPGSR